MVLLRALVVVAIGATAAIADDNGLARARAALESSDYVAARGALDDALASGTNRPEELIEIYRLRGVVAGALGDREAAREAFARMLELRPDFTFPLGTSPKTTEPFTAAVAELAGKRLEISIVTTIAPPTATLAIASDPLHLVARAKLSIEVDGRASERTIELGRPLALPAGTRIDVRGNAIDDRGNVVAVLVPVSIVAPKPLLVPDRVAPEPRSIYARWYVYAGAAAACGIVATGFELAARSASHELQGIVDDSSNHTFDEATRVAARGRRDVALADVGAVVSISLAVAAGVVFGLEHRRERLVVTPTSVAIGGAF